MAEHTCAVTGRVNCYRCIEIAEDEKLDGKKADKKANKKGKRRG